MGFGWDGLLIRYAKFRFDSYFRMKSIILAHDKEAVEEEKEDLLKEQMERTKRSEKVGARDRTRYL